jgi:hypothetical protein
VSERLQALEVDIDTRLLNLWATALEPDGRLHKWLDDDEELREVLGAHLRAAYGKGYCDALLEDANGRRSELSLAHGFSEL